MNSFLLSENFIARVIGAVVADETSRKFNRYFDFLTIASWSADTPLGDGGIGLSSDERAACGQRAAAYFGVDVDCLELLPTSRIIDWAQGISGAIRKKLTNFTFKSALRDEDASLCRHPAAAIFQDAAAAANVLYGRRRLLSFVAPHSLLGFELTILTPTLQRLESIDARGMTPEMLSNTLVYGDVLVATPSLWRYMMREQLRAPDNTMAVSFGEEMTQELAAEMRKAGFGVLRELYGSTENGLIGWRDAPGEAFALFDHWRREGDGLVRLSPASEVNDAITADYLQWKTERSFYLAGRRDGAVQIGAVNVMPEDVAQQLREHPCVADCKIKVSQRGDGVDRLVAHIVLKEQFQPDQRSAREIDMWCRSVLRQQERPRIFHFEAGLDHLCE